MEHTIHLEQRVVETSNQMTVKLGLGERNKLRREKSKEAVSLALKGLWEQAAEVNREILELFPEDVEAWNRLGKAFLELVRYDEPPTPLKGRPILRRTTPSPRRTWSGCLI